MFIGVLLVLLGVLMLLERTGIIYGQVWDYLLPAALVALGIHIVSRNRSKR
ncbi:MAG: DUF5668 domain-containing protein [candidate division Zixibacteria bacterium]|nr:DUF5668 domain-containing protein [candidate division Zixibacteria bacterium]